MRPYLNNIAIIEDEKDNYIGSTGFAVFRPIALDTVFIKYLLLSGYIRTLYLSYMSGFNSPGITNEQFIETVIPVPPLAEHKRIVEKLEKLMAFCDELEQTSAKANTTPKPYSKSPSKKPSNREQHHERHHPHKRINTITVAINNIKSVDIINRAGQAGLDKRPVWWRKLALQIFHHWGQKCPPLGAICPTTGRKYATTGPYLLTKLKLMQERNFFVQNTKVRG